MKLKVFSIDAETVQPAADLVGEVGNKAFNLMRLAALGLPVPPAFVLSTAYCRAWTANDRRPPADLGATLGVHVRRIENLTGLVFGDERRPLLLSVRSGAAASMPGMMDTMLNIGLTPRTLPGLIETTGNPRLAWDSLRRLVQSFAETVKERPGAAFDAVTNGALAMADVDQVADLDSLALRALTRDILTVYQDEVGESFPDDPMEQLIEAADAVFRSWDSERAVAYRQMNHLTGLDGTAVTVQRMVFGNAGSTSGSGVGFTRNPASGENRLYMDFQFNAQGEDVVSGRYALDGGAIGATLPDLLPAAYARLMDIRHGLEQAFGDAQDFEFTIQEGEVFMLQTRRAKRTPWAALKIAVDLVAEGLIEPAAALEQIADLDLETLGRRRLVGQDMAPLARAIPASIGVASGRIALDSKSATELAARGERVILVRIDTTTDDIAGMAAAEGTLTARGGRTSHAAVVARQLDKCCLVGCSALNVATDLSHCEIGGRRFVAGDEITLDADQGAVYAGILQVEIERPTAELAKIEKWRAALMPRVAALTA
jgi:pyruvate,orthophosphate dikinase